MSKPAFDPDATRLAGYTLETLEAVLDEREHNALMLEELLPRVADKNSQAILALAVEMIRYGTSTHLYKIENHVAARAGKLLGAKGE